MKNLKGIAILLSGFFMSGTQLLAGEMQETVTVGSKSFTESVILGEMLCHLAKETNVKVIHQKQLGGTRVLWNALLNGGIDVYPEYTGTLLREILAQENMQTDIQLEQALKKRGLSMTAPLGFNNTMLSV